MWEYKECLPPPPRCVVVVQNSSQDANYKLACRKPAMSLITPIDWLLCLSSPPLAGVIFGRSTVTAGPLERWAGDPLAE